MRQLEHERGGIDRLLSNFALYQVARREADTADPMIRQKIAFRSSRGTASAACSSCAR